MTRAPGGSDASRLLLQRIREVAATVSGEQDRLDGIVEAIAEVMGAEVCSIYIRRGENRLLLMATEGLNPEAVHTTALDVGEGLVGLVAESADAVNLPEAAEHERFAFRPETGEEAFHSFLGVPLLRGGRVVGVLTVQNVRPRRYGAEEVDALQTVAMVVAEVAARHEPPEAGPATGDRPVRLEGRQLNSGVALGSACLHEPRLPVHSMVAGADPAAEIARVSEALERMHRALDDRFHAADLAGEGEHREVLQAYRMFAEDQGWLARIRTGGAGRAERRGRGGAHPGADARADAPAARSVLPRAPARSGGPQQPAAAISGRRRQPGGARRPAGRRGADRPPYGAGGAARLSARAAPGRAAGGRLAGGPMWRSWPARSTSRCWAGSRIFPPSPRMATGSRWTATTARCSSGRARRSRRASGAPCARAPSAGRSSPRSATSRRASRDGVDISLNINAGLLIDIQQVEAVGAEGVGLYRTEIPFMVRSRFPELDDQQRLYGRALDLCGGRPLVFRTLDIGGDKVLPYWRLAEEENPAMGWRALRLTLDRPIMLRQQLCAMVRAAAGRALHVMFPMVAEVSEFDRARAILDAELEREKNRNRELPASVSVGAMLEVPALVWQLPALIGAGRFHLGRQQRSLAVSVRRRPRQPSGRGPLRSALARRVGFFRPYRGHRTGCELPDRLLW